MFVFFIVILIAGLVAVEQMRRRQPARWTPVLWALIGLIAVVLAFRFFPRSRTGPFDPGSMEYAAAVGHRAGRAVRETTPPGPVLVIATDRLAPGRWPAGARAQADGVEKALAGSGRRLERRLVPWSEDFFSVEGAVLSEEVLREALRACPAAGAIVLVDAAPSPALDPSGFPPFFATGVHGILIESLLRSGLVRGAALYRADAESPPVPPGGLSPDEVFALRFEWREGR